MVQGTLYVAIYEAPEDSKRHWALYLHVKHSNMEEKFIYQVVGEEGDLELNTREAISPEDSRRLLKLVFVSEIDSQEDIEMAKNMMEQQPTQNEIPSWNCQDWVMETLSALDEGDLLDRVSYEEAQLELEHMIG